MSPDVLAALAARHLDLVAAPFTLPSSRILLFRADQGDAGLPADGLRVHTAEYERPLDACRVLDLLEVRDERGLRCRIVDVRPDVIAFEGGGTLTFAGPAALSISPPPGGEVIWTRPGGTSDGSAPGTAVRIAVEPDRSVSVAPSTDHDKAHTDTASVWAEWFARCPIVRDDLQEMTAFCWWVLGANIVTLPHRDGARAVVPSKIGYVGLWQWDAYFIATGLRHGAPELAREQLDLALGFPTPDGQLPDVVHDHGTLSSSEDLPPADRANLRRDGSRVADAAAPIPLTKPPLAAWAVRKILDATGDDAWALSVLETVRRSQQWWFERSDSDGDGMPEYAHPYSSGLDDSPIFDGPLPIASPDLAAYLIVQDRELADLCRRVDTGDPAFHLTRAARTATLLNRMWHPDRGAFLAGDDPTDAVVGLMPLLTGTLPTGIAATLAEAVRDPRRFGAPWSVPTVAVADPRFAPERMWRGPVWVNTNYLIAEGLDRSGFAADARRLREQTVRLVVHAGGPHEYFNPQTGCRARTATTAFGWSAALFVDLAVQLTD